MAHQGIDHALTVHGDNLLNGQRQRCTITEPIQVCQLDQQNRPFELRELDPLFARYPYGEGDEIIFEFPQEGYLDPESIEIMFNVRWAYTADAIRTFTAVSPISAVFSQMRLTIGDNYEIERIEEYGMLQKIFNNLLNTPNTQLSSRGVFNGTQSWPIEDDVHYIHRRSYHSQYLASGDTPGNVARRYRIKPNLGLFNQCKALPLKYLANVRLRMRVDMSKISGNLMASSINNTDVKVEIGKVKLYYKKFDISPEFDNQVTQMISTGNLLYQIQSWDHTRVNIPIYRNGGANDRSDRHFEFDIPIYRKWLKYAFAVIRCEDDQVLERTSLNTYGSLDPTIGDATGELYTHNTSLRSYQWLYNDVRIPSYPVPVFDINKPQELDVSGVIGQETTAGFATPCVEAHYQVEQLFRQGWLPGVLGNEASFSYYNMAAGDRDFYNGYIGTVSSNPRRPCNLTLVGLFSSPLPNGEISALQGDCGQKLKLILDFNHGVNEISTVKNPNPPRMFIDIYTCSDRVISIKPGGVITYVQ